MSAKYVIQHELADQGFSHVSLTQKQPKTFFLSPLVIL